MRTMRTAHNVCADLDLTCPLITVKCVIMTLLQRSFSSLYHSFFKNEERSFNKTGKQALDRNEVFSLLSLFSVYFPFPLLRSEVFSSESRPR